MACPNRNLIQNLENQLLNDRVLMEEISRSTQQSVTEATDEIVMENKQKKGKLAPESCHRGKLHE